MRYAVVIKKAGENFSAYAPDLPGCAATGGSLEEAQKEIAAAIQFHLEGMIEDGESAPPPSAVCAYIEA